MIKRFPDGTAKPFLPPSEYAELRDDDRFLYNEGTTPSARITGDKGRENPAEGAPYGEGLIGRITALEAREAELVEAAEALKQDLLERAEWDRSEAVKIVAAGNGVWSRFCATLAKARQSEGGE